MWFWYLIGCSASEGPERELLRFILGSRAQNLLKEIMCCFRIGNSNLKGKKSQATKQALGTS